MRLKKAAFTMLELIFVIVIMGIIGKFGVEFLAQAYKSFIFSSINNGLQSNSEMAVELIASKLQYRIKDSIIARTAPTALATPLANASGSSFIILEWIGSDIDGFRSTTKPAWSGIIDLDAGNANLLVSPETNTSEINTLIQTLSHGSGTTLSDAALYFEGSNNDISGFGWDAASAFTNQAQVMHPIQAGVGINTFTSSVAGDFTGIDVYEYYKLAWTAYAVVLENYNINKYAGRNMGDLVLYYDYQPWEGDKFSNAKSAVIMEGVSTFQSMAIGSIVKIQVCVKSDLTLNDTYSLCKEKTIL